MLTPTSQLVLQIFLVIYSLFYDRGYHFPYPESLPYLVYCGWLAWYPIFVTSCILFYVLGFSISSGSFKIPAGFSAKQFFLSLLFFNLFSYSVSFYVVLPLGCFTFFLGSSTCDWRAMIFSSLSYGALYLLVFFSSLNFCTARCIRLSGRMLIPSSYPSCLCVTSLKNTFIDAHGISLK